MTSVSNVISYIGSAVAMTAGIGVAVVAQLGGNSDQLAKETTAGLIAAYTGLFTAIGKIYLDERKANRQATIDRDKMSIRLDNAIKEITKSNEERDRLEVKLVETDERFHKFMENDNELIGKTCCFNLNMIRDLAVHLGIDLPVVPDKINRQDYHELQENMISKIQDFSPAFKGKKNG